MIPISALIIRLSVEELTPYTAYTKMINFIVLVSCWIALTAATAPNLFEGDIVLTDNTRNIMKGGPAFDGISNPQTHWKNGIVPYVFSSGFDSSRIAKTKAAMSEYHSKTCIRFKPRTTETDYIRFIVGSGCYSYIGRIGRSQDVSIGHGCTSPGTIIHELMHAVGFFHEQSRLDRDNYINIYWQNIPAGVKSNFEKYSHGEADYFGANYDLDSVMHYSRTAFGSGKVTISAKSDYNRKLGQRKGFTQTDISQINMMYKCAGATSPPQTVQPKTTYKPQTVKPSGTCIDKHSSCSYWASVGECQKSASYMKYNCKKSCKLCSVSSCYDKDSNCLEYKSRGYCVGGKFVPWMGFNCKRTCKFC